jgi:biopolymer transport protein TolQ
MRVSNFCRVFVIIFGFATTAHAEGQVELNVNTDAWHAILGASPIVQLTLCLLATLSILSWAVILQKRSLFEEVEEANAPFEDTFFKANSLEDINDNIQKFSTSNLATVFRSGFLELKKIAESSLAKPGEGDSAPLLSGMDNLQRALHKAIDSEVSRLESRLSFLATVGSVSPFIGLFGTVWGIMAAFQKIGASGSASLAVVAPGISEALIATAIGLFAAIPAAVGYNLFVAKIKKQELILNNFASDFLNIAKRNFFRGA